MGARTWGGSGGRWRCALSAPAPRRHPATADRDRAPVPAVDEAAATPARGEVTLAFAGDVHFEAHVGTLMRRDLGPISRTLRAADVAMVNLETPVTVARTSRPQGARVRLRPLLLPDAAALRWTRWPRRVSTWSASPTTTPATTAQVGLTDTIRAARRHGVAVVGAGRDAAEAFTPHVVGRTASTWRSWPPTPCSARVPATCGRPVRATPGSRRPRGQRYRPAARRRRVRGVGAGPLVVVYLHWGRENEACPDPEPAPARPRARRRGRRRRRRQPLARARRRRLVRRLLRVLRARQLRLVPLPAARHRRADRDASTRTAWSRRPGRRRASRPTDDRCR